MNIDNIIKIIKENHINEIKVSIEEAQEYFTLTNIEGEYVIIYFNGNADIFDGVLGPLVENKLTMHQVIEFLLNHFGEEWIYSKIKVSEEDMKKTVKI